jgi:hypothetical protein
MNNNDANDLKYFFLCDFTTVETMLGINLKTASIIISIIGILLNTYFITFILINPKLILLMSFVFTVILFVADTIGNLIIFISALSRSIRLAYTGYIVYSFLYIILIISTIVPFLIGFDMNEFGTSVYVALIVNVIYILLRPYFTYIIYSWLKNFELGMENDNNLIKQDNNNQMNTSDTQINNIKSFISN